MAKASLIDKRKIYRHVTREDMFRVSWFALNPHIYIYIYKLYVLIYSILTTFGQTGHAEHS